MTEGSTDPGYLAAHVADVLAADDRTNELGIRVSVDGDCIRLRGRVSTENHRGAITTVVSELVGPGFEICNDVEVVGDDVPLDREIVER